MPDLTVVILAAGEGTRMRSSTPKVLHELCGMPLVLWPVLAAREAGATRIVVVDGPARRLEKALPDGVELAVQAMQRGTGDAVRAAAGHIDDDATVVVLMGDVPLITAHAITALVSAHGTGATMLTMILDDPGDYGRVIRAAGGAVERVVEAKGAGDATPEQLAIKEVNTGVFCFDGGALKAALARVTPDNAQGEYYLPDVLPLMPSHAHVTDDFSVTLGVNDRVDLVAVRAHAQRRIHEYHLRNGVTIVDPASTSIDAGVEIGQDTIIEPQTTIKAGTRIGAHCHIRHAYIDQATLADGVTVGPFAYLRPGTHLMPGSKAGTFVEIKNSVIGPGSKIPHLSYIGDADVGENCNLGAATITANYNNATKVKSRTTVGDRVKTSVDTTLVAPVKLHDDASTGAGSVIVEDVPPGALGIARARQRNIEGYADRKEREKA
ncbi:MAG: bifunctional UDP-N-acetylglucosamine pyrophosphorylase / glucosamine-phosphate N-acetyltransferase [Solirubrobacteraceae bacterium]|nr:bifunctional UDP-N-acetylglucosamine pyrophosphorylase / glucosamine-phosphate N-acetyltransferase [Solirubrobacteraceae bacterium]